MPLANAFPRSPEDFASEGRYPLDLSFCADCSLVQLVDVIAPEILFTEYLYLTGTSDTMAAHHRSLASSLAGHLGLGPGDLVAEIASNDGGLLECFRALGVRTLGIEPAGNIADLARSRGIETLTMFFDATAARTVVEDFGHARLIIANNVLAHVDDPLGFLAGCRALVQSSGLVVIEVPYLGDLLARLEFDTVYHEHLCYFSMTALVRLCDEAGLAVERLERLPVHGGSLRLFLRRADAGDAHCAAASDLMGVEEREGLRHLARYARFAADVADNRDGLRRFLAALARDGRAVAAYGAPAKGTTLLNFCGIDTGLVAYTVDKSPLKAGRYIPGTHQPVYPVATLIERQPDCALLLPWNLADEILGQQREYLAHGGRFVLPIPQPRFA